MMLGTKLWQVELKSHCIHPAGREYGKAYAMWYSRQVVMVVNGLHQHLVLSEFDVQGRNYNLSKAELVDVSDLFTTAEDAERERTRRQKQMEQNQLRIGFPVGIS